MKKLFLLLSAAVLFNVATGQNNDTLIHTIIIGKQTWMTSNLNVSHFKNGDELPQAKNSAEWQKYGKEHKPAWCYYGFDEKNAEKYGKLYNYYAVSDARGLAPEGWHIPVNDDWNKLKETVSQDVTVAGKFLKKEKGWKGSDGNNKSGFSAVPSGLADGRGYFHYIKTHSYLWSASPLTPKSEAWSFVLYGDSDKAAITRECEALCGLAIRCVKN